MRRGVGPRGVRRRRVRLRPGSVEQRVPVTGLRARGSGELCAAVTIAVLTVIPRRRSCVAGIHGACQARAGHPPAAKSTCHAPPHTAPRGRTTRQTPAPHVPPLPRRAAGPRTRGQTRPAARRAHSTWPRMLLDGAHGRSARARASRIVRRRVPRCPAVGPACRRPCFHAAAASPDQPPSPTTPMPTRPR